MKLIYKIAIPAFLALILIILSVALWQKRFIGEALSREEFLTINETVARRTLEYLKADNFLEPFSALSQKQFKELADELHRPSIARLTIWNRDQVIVFSNLKSIIGFHSADHEDLKRLFAEEPPFFIVKKEETNEPVQSEIGEFLDIYTPIRISGKVVGAVEIHSVIAGILAPIEMYVSTGSNILVAASVSILAIVLVVFSRDIAERKRAEESLREEKTRYRTLFEQSPDGVLIIDPETALPIEFNEAAHRQLGYLREEFARLQISEYEAIEKREETKTHIEKLLREGKDSFETKHRTKQGEIRDVFVTVQTIELSGRPVFHTIFRDITDLKRAGQKIDILREIDKAITSTLDLRSVLDLLLDKIALLLPYSAVTVRLFNKESGLLEPVTCRNLDEKEWKAEQWRAGRGPPNVVFETKTPLIATNVQNDPRVRDREFFIKHRLTSYLGLPLIVKDEVLGVLSFYTRQYHEFDKEETDFLVTLANQAAIAIYNAQLYEETAKLASSLARSNRVKDEFLRVMSHELRTPLNVVMGYTGMIKDGLLGEINPEQEKALEKIINQARDQLTLISGMLHVTQLETEWVKVASEEIRLGDFLNDLRSGYEFPLNKKIAVNWDYASDLPVIRNDSAKLKQILQNLINNAIKFIEVGSVTISVRIKEPDSQDAEGHGQTKFVEFKVADTGIGIAKEHLPFIFEKFKQVDSSETRLYGGVGLGLYIVKKLAEVMGGRVEVESEPGKGSTFTVTMPLGQ